MVELALDGPVFAQQTMFEFSWPGFWFAVINFLVLVGLLYWFLHKPILNALDARRRRIADAEKAAQDQTAEAQKAQEEYQQKLAGIQEERDRLLSETRQRADAARDEMLVKAREAAERETANLRRDWQRQLHDAVEALADDIVAVSLDLARRVLTKLTDADVDQKLLAGLDDQLRQLATSADAHARQNLFEGGAPVRVTTAKPLDPERQQQIAEQVNALADGSVDVTFDTDPDLVAGARVAFSSMAIDASLADVLVATRERFAELAAGEEGESAAEGEGESNHEGAKDTKQGTGS